MVKWLFMVLAEREGHAWFKRLDPLKIDFGKGKRAFSPGGFFHARYQITTPLSWKPDPEAL
jgi:hypothetical protein